MSINRTIFTAADVVANATTVECSEGNNIFTVGASYWTDSTYSVNAVPTLGSILVEGLSAVTGQWITIGTLTASTVTDEFSVTKEISFIRATPSAINVAANYKLCVVGRA